MFGTKQAILAIAGVSALGGASVGCYYCFKPKAPESSQTTSSSSLSTSTTQGTSPKTTDPVQREGDSLADVPSAIQPPLRGQDAPIEGSSSSGLTTSTSPTTTSVGNVDSPQVGTGGVGA
ncbi:hypothetical protein A6V39_00235 [Candidatus Mycoplasma haematobovis]|uniref:Uncharacterized protein n=1 Tax=Candidatus Mycoplasma haematobovis TaxID=432608 RepID=A0A1A9QDC2_9MOLU|nr:hypothetical protein [Candidatus Mycoplasma haematobovis]OAL10477.1 hypothetical protein A6V39_00235 [Candidatus Mycoplasma haematobovis]